MLQLVDYWIGGYSEKEQFGILNTDTLELNYYSKDKIDTFLNKGIYINGLVTTDFFEQGKNNLKNKYIKRVTSSKDDKVIYKSCSKVVYNGITLVLEQPIKLKKLINGVKFEYKGVTFYFRHTQQNGRHIFIKQLNWKEEHLKIIKDIVSMSDYLIEIEYPFRVNTGRNSLFLQPLLNVLNNRKYVLTACNWTDNYGAIEYVNMGNIDFSKLRSFNNLLKESVSLKYIDFSNSITDLDLFNDCITKNVVVSRQSDKIQDALNTFLYFLKNNKYNYPIVFILRKDMKCFAEFLCSDKRVNYLGSLKRDNNLFKRIDILLGKFVIIKQDTLKTNNFVVFVE